MAGAQPREFTFAVVSAVYRVEAWLGAFFAALEAQTLGVAGIQVVLVDDGSDDRSGEMCRAWCERHAAHAVYVRQDNAGAWAARNAGLAHVTARWVTFIDPDDTVDADYFEQVGRALAAHAGDPPCMVSCNLMPFRDDGAPIAAHVLAWKFAHGERMVDLDRSARPEIHLQAGSAFFERRSIHAAGLTFRDIRPAFEDADFTARYLLLQRTRRVLLVPAARYRYRKRGDASSLTDRLPRDPRAYSDMLEHGYLGLLQHARQVEGRPPAWVQVLVLYCLSWQFLRLIDQHAHWAWVPVQLRPAFFRLLQAIFRHIEPAVLDTLEMGALDDLQRVGMAALCQGRDAHAPWVEIFFNDRRAGQLGLRLLHGGVCPPLRFFRDDEEQPAAHRKTRLHFMLEREFAREEIVWLPWPQAGTLRVEAAGAPLGIRIGRGAPIAAVALPAAAHIRPQVARVMPPAAQQLRALAVSGPLAARYRKAWLLMDRPALADDNAEYLYRHIKGIGMPVNAWFVLTREAPAWPRLAAEGFRLLEFGSMEHRVALLNAEHLVSSHADDYTARLVPPQFHADQLNFSVTFLHHGVTVHDASEYLNQYRISHLICSTAAEAESMGGDGNGYQFCKREVALTGMPRHDSLLALSRTRAPQKVILIAPTWRRELAATLRGADARAVEAAIMGSQFFRAWHAVITAPALQAAVRSAGYRLEFLAHPLLHSLAGRFAAPGVTLRAHGESASVQEMLVDAEILVTDYSSFAFEFAYLQKPLLYYQFDEAAFFGGTHSCRRGYFDYDLDGFGPVCRDHASLIDQLRALMGRAGRADPVYARRMREVFPFRDGNCAERVYRRIAASGTALPAEPLSLLPAHA